MKLRKEAETSPGKISGGSANWECTGEAELAFRKLQRILTDVPILQHFDHGKPIILQTDASGIGIAGILDQDTVFTVLRPKNF
jgi:hypothetical protein